MRVREVLLGLEDVDPESDCRVWADGMRVITTRYGAPVESTDRGLHIVSRGQFRPGYIGDDEEEGTVPQESIGYVRRHWVTIKPKLHLPETMFFQTEAGRQGQSNVVHYLDHDRCELKFEVRDDGSYGDTVTWFKSWCGQRALDEKALTEVMPAEHRLCLTCERKFDEWHTACEGCGVVTHNDEMHSLGGDQWGDGGLAAFPSECEACFKQRERVEAPYRQVMGA